MILIDQQTTSSIPVPIEGEGETRHKLKYSLLEIRSHGADAVRVFLVHASRDVQSQSTVSVVLRCTTSCASYHSEEAVLCSIVRTQNPFPSRRWRLRYTLIGALVEAAFITSRYVEAVHTTDNCLYCVYIQIQVYCTSMYRYGRRVNVNVNGSHSHIKYIPRSLELKGLYSTRREFEIRDSRNGTENSVGRDLPRSPKRASFFGLPRQSLEWERNHTGVAKE